jgi:hypothetical protein
MPSVDQFLTREIHPVPTAQILTVDYYRSTTDRRQALKLSTQESRWSLGWSDSVPAYCVIQNCPRRWGTNREHNHSVQRVPQVEFGGIDGTSIKWWWRVWLHIKLNIRSKSGGDGVFVRLKLLRILFHWQKRKSRVLSLSLSLHE